MRTFNFNCMDVLTYSCVGGRGRRRARGQKSEVQGWDTCERAPPWCSSFPSCPSYNLPWDGKRRRGRWGWDKMTNGWTEEGKDGKHVGSRRGPGGGVWTRTRGRARGRRNISEAFFSRSIRQHSHQHGKQLVLHSIRTFPQTANSLHSPCQRSTTLSIKGKREELCGRRDKKKKKKEEDKEVGGAGVEAENKSKIGCFTA